MNVGCSIAFGEERGVVMVMALEGSRLSDGLGCVGLSMVLQGYLYCMGVVTLYSWR